MKTYYDLEIYDNGMMTGVLQSDIENYANERFKELFLKKEGEKDASKAKDKNH